MKKLKEFLTSDIKILNSYFIIALTLVILVSVGYFSYALFSKTILSDNTIIVESGDILNQSYSYNSTKEYYIYTIPIDGYYYVELNGAAGGYGLVNGAKTHAPGKGSKTTGYIDMKAGEKLYIYVGSKGEDAPACGTQAVPLIGGAGGYNGGGKGGNDTNTTIDCNNEPGGGGGGATDIRYFGDDIPTVEELEWDSDLGLNSRIMVAAGGGGSSYYGTGGAGGGLQGTTGNIVATIGTQTSGNDFGIGENGLAANAGSGGGGAGYYGGGTITNSGGSGGSSFISGYAGVNAITAKNDTANPRTHSGDTKHYSNKYFVSGKMMPGAHIGNGTAIIKYQGESLERINSNLNNVRYIKDCIRESSGSGNHWAEIQVIQNGKNIAKKEEVTVMGTSDETSGYSYSRVKDGNISSSLYATTLATGLQCVVVDLKAHYDVDEIAVWHYWADERAYYDNVTYTSRNTISEWTRLTDSNFTWNEVINETILENSEGKRVSAYQNIQNGYIQNDLILWYDGIINYGFVSDARTTTTTWKDLSGNSNNGTLANFGLTTTSGWNEQYLAFDGTDDTVDTGLYAATTLLPNAAWTMSILVKVNSLPYTATTNGNTGVLFGAANYSGMGIIWESRINNVKRVASFLRTDLAPGYSAFQTTNVPSEIMLLTIVNKPSSNLGYFYINGEEFSTYDISSVKGGTYSSIMGNIGINKAQMYGGSYTISYANMNVYSARIYGKTLTADEVAHNYNIDKIRFGL